MTSHALPARAPAGVNGGIVVPRVLWIEGATPSIGAGAATARLGAPKLAEDDARVAFAFALPEAARELLASPGLPLVVVPPASPLPPASDPRWQERAFVAPGERPQDLHLTIRRSTLLRAAQLAPEGLAAALRRALAEFEAPRRVWRLAGRELPLARSTPAVMAVINLTPDSFSDGGRWNAVAAVARGEELAQAGAALLDVGGESTRPGSLPVDAQLEIERVAPVIERLARRVAVPISIDTTKAAVARAAIAAGATIVNDTSALADDPVLAAVVAETGAGVVLTHRRGTPRTMQDAPRYDDCVAEVAESLASRAAFAIEAGVAPDAIVLDPGIGFGKRLEDNLDLVAAAGSLRSLGFPLLLGASRKSFLGALTGRAAPQRDAATLATTAVAFATGCELIRAHDVAGSVDLLKVLAALRNEPARKVAQAGSA